MTEDFRSLRPPPEVVGAYPPSRDGLFDFLRAQVSDGMLRSIAKGDENGTIEANFAALMRIRDGHDLDRPMGGIPGEALELYPWTEPPDRDLGESEFAIASAFCHTALLRVPDEYENRSPFEHGAFAQLVEAAESLGAPFRRHLACLLTWSLQEMEFEDPNYLFDAFGLLVTIAHADDAPPGLFTILGDWLVAANGAILPRHPLVYADAKTFMDIRWPSTVHTWREFAERLKTREDASPALREFLDQMTRRKTLGQHLEDVGMAVRVAPIVARGVGLGLKEIWRQMRRRGR